MPESNPTQESQSIPWLSASNDVREVLAAAENEFFKGAVEVMVIPTDMDVSTPYRPLAPTVNAFGTLEISGVTPDQAKKLRPLSIHLQER